MRITPITFVHSSKPNRTAKSVPAFKAHPDFYGYNSTVSCYFRRGACIFSCAKGYENIENLFCKIFKQNINSPKKMLIIGIGDSQEPFSYLTSINGILNGESLKNNLDLHTVDLQSKPERIKLKKDAFCELLDYQTFPKYAEKGFVKDSTDNWLEIKHQDNSKSFENSMYKYIHKMIYNKDRWTELTKKGYSIEKIYEIMEAEEKQKSLRWRVNDEVFEFLEQTYNNPQKSKWESLIQDVINLYPNEKFDIISANNVLPYILNEDELIQTLQHIERTLKPDGHFITDPYKDMYNCKKYRISDAMTLLYPGIYKKV